MEHPDFKAVIYINPNQHNVSTIDQLNRTRSILSEYWEPSNILVVNCGHDYAIQKWLREESGGKRMFPQIYIGDVRIGFFEDLKAAQESGLLALMCDQDMSSSLRLSIVPGNSDDEDTEEEESEEEEEDVSDVDPDFVKKHVVTSWFDAGSWLVNAAKGVLNFLDAPSLDDAVDDWKYIPSDQPAPQPHDDNIEEVAENVRLEEDVKTNPESIAPTVTEIPTPINDPIPPPDATPKEEEPKEEEEFETFELEFVRTNWLWRSQSRVYRFKRNEFERVEKTAATNGSLPTERVCAVFPYSIVSKVDKIDDKNVIIRFNNGTEDQHLSSDSAERVNKLVETMNRCNSATPAPVL
eukprot:TRINITY_DN1077_c0_g1_i1.p1 TRINITY_DN1077_c0_g1~~TRINITY_DN1077_c0_g1_i1.p1  ORF type:complete len:352 (-),score=103.11 TRINITY_DN1077_c0_g1_i1:84-1139(-)